MMIIELDRCLASSKISRMQWRGSDDGIQWTEWVSLFSETQKVPLHLYYQARIEISGHWEYSKIEREF